jgi:hypothetical protein
MSSRRSVDIVEHAVADFCKTASTDPDLPALAGRGLGALAEMDRLASKWQDKLRRGDKKTLTDFALLRRWRLDWLEAAKVAADRGAPALEATMKRVQADLAEKDPRDPADADG